MESGLAAEDRLLAADFALGQDGMRFVTWIAERTDGTARASTLFVAKAGSGGWGQPREMAPSATSVRLVAGEDGMHLVVAPGLRHWVNGAGGEWQEQDPFPAGPEGRMRAFDGGLVGGSVVVASMWDTGGMAAGGETLLLLSRAGASAPQRLAAWPASPFDPARPCLWADGERAWILVGRNAQRRGPRGVSIGGELFLLSSEDAGRTWSDPVPIPVDADLRRGARTGSIDSVALAVRDREVIVFYSSAGIYVTRREAGGDWSEPRRVGQYATSFARGTFETSEVRAVWPAAGLAVAWIDARNRSRRHGGANPLGGFPWSDDASHYLENDVFVAFPPAPGVQAEAAWRVRRLSADSSFAHSLRLRASGKDLLAFWAGRPGIGKDIASFASPPQLYLSTVSQP